MTSPADREFGVRPALVPIWAQEQRTRLLLIEDQGGGTSEEEVPALDMNIAHFVECDVKMRQARREEHGHGSLLLQLVQASGHQWIVQLVPTHGGNERCVVRV